MLFIFLLLHLSLKLLEVQNKILGLFVIHGAHERCKYLLMITWHVTCPSVVIPSLDTGSAVLSGKTATSYCRVTVVTWNSFQGNLEKGRQMKGKN